MNYFLDLFSPETYEAFGRSDRSVSGFRPRHKNAAERVRTGDKLVCYMTRVSRWFGVLEVLKGPFRDNTPIFLDEADPFVVRFRVKPIVWLAVEKAVPIYEDAVWNQLSFTKGQTRGTPTWTGRVRTSLVQLSDADGRLLESLLLEQSRGGGAYPLDPADSRKLATHRVRRLDKDVTVTVPEDRDEDLDQERAPQAEVRESIQIQALLAEIGAHMGMQIWVPRADRAAVVTEWRGDHPPPLHRLPLNYDETTLRTIEQIDVLWLRGRSIRRAFEVEHTTSVYSGILRMADLLALQPNMEIRLHIVAPSARREKVLQELRRPVFSLLERGPLFESCTYLSYDSLRELAKQPNLAHLKESVLEDYEEGPRSNPRRPTSGCSNRAARGTGGRRSLLIRSVRPSSTGMRMHARVASLIEQRGLEPHPESGYFRQVFRSSVAIQPSDVRPLRSALTTIYYLLAAEQTSAWHRVSSDEVWHFYEGHPLELLWLDAALASCTWGAAWPSGRSQSARGGRPRRLLAGGEIPRSLFLS